MTPPQTTTMALSETDRSGSVFAPRRAVVIANAVILQLGWFAAVLGAARGAGWWGPACCAAAAMAYVLLAAAPGRLALRAKLVPPAIWPRSSSASFSTKAPNKRIRSLQSEAVH